MKLALVFSNSSFGLFVEVALNEADMAELGLPISAFMDRQKTSIAQCQMGFISVLVKPLYAEWRKLLGDDLQPAIDLLQLSLSGWETDGNKLCEGWDL